MNIIIFVSSLEIGGAQKQAVLDVNLLAENHRVYLYSFSDGPLRKLVDENVRVEIVKKDGYLSTARRVRKMIRERRIDIIHASLFAPIVISTLASVFTRTRVIWHFHSHEYDVPTRSNLAFRWLSRWPNVRRILFVNHELLEYFHKLRFPKSKMGVQYNHSEINAAPQNGVRKPDNTVHIGYLGRVIELKRVDYLVDLAVHLLAEGCGQFRIHVVGDGETLEEVRALADRKGVADHLEFHGFQTDVVRYYRSFDFFVNPSREECLSIAMIDAGMMALPIVAFDVGGNNEIVVDGQTGFIVNDKEGFLQKCQLLAQDQEMRRAFGEAGRRHCRRLFSRERHAEELQNIYQAVTHAH